MKCPHKRSHFLPFFAMKKELKKLFSGGVNRSTLLIPWEGNQVRYSIFFFKHDNIPDWSFAGDFVRKHSFLALHITKQPAGDHKVKNRSFDETFKCLPSVEETFKRKEDYASES